jgi:hypothetical protein
LAVTDTENKQDMNPEQAADFAALKAAAAAGATQTYKEAGDIEPESTPKPDLGAEIAAALEIVATVLKKPFPSVANLYDENTRAMVGASVAAVCNKHGWLQGGMMGKWGEEIACLMIVGPLAYSTYEAGKSDIAKLKATAERAPATLEKANAPVTVTSPDKPMHAVTIGKVIPNENQ